MKKKIPSIKRNEPIIWKERRGKCTYLCDIEGVVFFSCVEGGRRGSTQNF